MKTNPDETGKVEETVKVRLGSKNFFRNQNGQALIEFALVLTLFLTIFAGVLDFGRLIYTKNVLDKVTREAARAGSVRIDDFDAINTAVVVGHDVLTSMKMSYTVELKANVVQLNGMDAISVTASYPFKSLFGISKIAVVPPINLNSTAVMRKEG